ncbi:MAG: hypothetical protein LQ340_001403 [Diploschistes diacapsis]|nr:MAG: hypothetical protein LQ340_001403 [Diploschistes diacapsis]
MSHLNPHHPSSTSNSRLSTLPSHLRQSSIPSSLSSTFAGSSSGAGGPSPALVARIKEKKAELERLRELRDLSAALAGQMERLKGRLEVLGNGTEAVAAVLANWHNVLRAISMASTKIPPPPPPTAETSQAEPEPARKQAEEASTPQLPQTLVRIPVALEGGTSGVRGGEGAGEGRGDTGA